MQTNTKWPLGIALPSSFKCARNCTPAAFSEGTVPPITRFSQVITVSIASRVNFPTPAPSSRALVEVLIYSGSSSLRPLCGVSLIPPALKATKSWTFLATGGFVRFTKKKRASRCSFPLGLTGSGRARGCLRCPPKRRLPRSILAVLSAAKLPFVASKSSTSAPRPAIRNGFCERPAAVRFQLQPC